MRQWIFSAWLALCLVAPVGAVELEVQPSYERDRQIVLRLADAPPEAVTSWFVTAGPELGKPDSLVIEGGFAMCVWAQPGTYEVVVTVVMLEDADLVANQVVGVFKVEGVVDPNPPPPDPDDPVVGDFSHIPALVVKLASPVKDKTKSEAARLIAAAYASAREELQSYENLAALVDTTHAAVSAELGINRFLYWRPAFLRLRDEVARLKEAGTVVEDDKATWGALWDAFAAGFNKVADSE